MQQNDSCKRGGRSEDWLKEGAEMSRRTYMHSPWTRTMVWGLPKGVGGTWESKWGKIRTAVIA